MKKRLITSFENEDIDGLSIEIETKLRFKVSLIIVKKITENKNIVEDLKKLC